MLILPLLAACGLIMWFGYIPAVEKAIRKGYSETFIMTCTLAGIIALVAWVNITMWWWYR